jgi:UTP--glucose-1-phosphate uridylyltransferase
MYAYEFDGIRFDAGDKLGYLKANVAYGIRHTELGKEFKEHLKEIVAGL